MADRNRCFLPRDEIIVADFNSGLTGQEIANKHGVGKSRVFEILKKLGLSRRPKAFIPPDSDLLHCLAEGISCKAIAHKFGGHADNISRYIRRNGLREIARVETAVPQISVKRHGIVIDKRRDYVLGRNEFREMNISLPALSILEGCERYGSAA